MRYIFSTYTAAIGIPILLIICGGLSKRIIKGYKKDAGSSKWDALDFSLGVEMCLTATASALVYCSRLGRELSHLPGLEQENIYISALGRVVSTDEAIYSIYPKLSATAFFVTFCLSMLLYLLSVHQDWEKQTQSPKQRIAWLLGFSNLIGAGLIAIFILAVKGV